jgi:antitoxin component YwqK of YwqJK toxin-antitoxin module
MKQFTYTLTIAIALITSFSIYAQTDGINKKDAKGLKQGKWQKSYANGKIKYTGQFVNDTPLGTFYYYYDNGKVEAINIFDAKTKGLAHNTFYHDNGNVQSQGNYINQLKDSTWEYYSFDKHLIAQETYIGGKVTGVSKKFYLNGKLSEETNFVNGLENGNWRAYFPSGALKDEATYAKGEIEGKSTSYFETGKEYCSGYYKHGIRIGTWLYFKENGALERKAVYKNGVDTLQKQEPVPVPLPNQNIEEEFNKQFMGGE